MIEKNNRKNIFIFFIVFLSIYFWYIYWGFFENYKIFDNTNIIKIDKKNNTITDNNVYLANKKNITIEKSSNFDYDLQFVTNDVSWKICDISSMWSGDVVSMWCVANYLKKNTTKTNSKLFTQNVENIRPYIDDFSYAYQLYSWSFYYTGSIPIFKEKKMNDFYKFLEKIKLSDSSQIDFWKNVLLNFNELAILKVFHYEYYVTKREKLNQLSKCTRTNYNVALISIDKKILEPNEIFNVNKRLAYRIWYCANKEDYQKYIFHSGVCGASTQIFRIGLLHPNIEIVERRPHNIRYSKYYDNIVRWDDAGIIEFRKQLKIKNKSQYPIYFKYIEKWDVAFLVWISSQKSDSFVKITKKQTWKLAWEVQKDIYNKESVKIDNIIRKSNYDMIYDKLLE